MRGPVLSGKRARDLRRAMTPPEVVLWVRLRGRRPGLPAFRRQHPFGPYILDFYCAALGLAIKVDGMTHGEAEASAHDARRDAWLRGQGVEVRRLAAAEVLADPDATAEFIWNLVRSRLG